MVRVAAAYPGVRPHVLICILVAYLAWHLRARPGRRRPAPRRPTGRRTPIRSAAAGSTADCKRTTAETCRLVATTGLLAHLDILTRNDLHYGDNSPITDSRRPPPFDDAPSNSSTPSSHWS
ncbi:hypothetical protein RW1_005_01390 [Rhodococcus wratislaviensis NBRC 100605]|uniref:Uncharacterized protein n=1 Tax=Rhodococcus wratislaviensis NBRC 100605 TaxID=1219028 RepID=X0QWR9_RHOWR|nr:hypothetical protein RW1_005_01390 [Rhodococcus wratislaviensis NBRC 100605]